MRLKYFVASLGLALGLGLVVGTVQAVATPTQVVDRAVGVGMLQRGTDYHNRMTADPKRVAEKVSVTNKKPCRTKKSTRCTWANSYHYGDTLSWWRGTGTKWNVSDKRARDRLQTFFHAMYGEHAGALKFGGTLHPYCWWNDQGTAVLCGDGARKRY